MKQHNIYNADFNFGFVNFDDELIGKHVKVCYTHHEPPNKGKVGLPKFLAFKKDGTVLDFYLIGLSNAKEWIKDIDNKIDTGIIK